MKILHLENKGSHPFHYTRMERRKGIDSKLLFPENNIRSHPLWEMVDTDLEEVRSEGEYPSYPKKWIDENRDKIPSWVEAIPYEGEGNPGHSRLFEKRRNGLYSFLLNFFN